MRERLAETPMEDLFYSFGTSHPGAITLHNYPRFLQRLERPDGTRSTWRRSTCCAIARARRAAVQRVPAPAPPEAGDTFEELTDSAGWTPSSCGHVRGDVERVDLMVGLYAEPQPKGFGFSDTAFRIFILMASRRLKSDRFFTRDYGRRSTPARASTGSGEHDDRRAQAALPRAGACYSETRRARFIPGL